MKNIFLLALIVPFLLLGCSESIPKSNKQELGQAINKFDENYAISKVIKEHPEFPSSVGSKEISLDDVGKQGHKLMGSLETKAEKSGQNEYIIILTKKWNIKVNGTDAVSYWKYKVTPDNIILIDSKEKADIIDTIK